MSPNLQILLFLKQAASLNTWWYLGVGLFGRGFGVCLVGAGFTRVVVVEAEGCEQEADEEGEREMGLQGVFVGEHLEMWRELFF